MRFDKLLPTVHSNEELKASQLKDFNDTQRRISPGVDFSLHKNQQHQNESPTNPGTNKQSNIPTVVQGWREGELIEPFP